MLGTLLVFTFTETAGGSGAYLIVENQYNSVRPYLGTLMTFQLKSFQTAELYA
jgi:hypothetical protein